jgi:hypothetical protein
MVTQKNLWLVPLYILLLLVSVPWLRAVHAENTAVPVIPTQLCNPAEIQQNLIMDLINEFNPWLIYHEKVAICETIISEASSTGFDPFFISSVIAAESSFKPRALSPCAAQGLMQITSDVADSMNIKNPFDIRENIYGGTHYLMNLHQTFAQNEMVLAAYNAGPTTVARLGRVPRIKETVTYIERVTSFYAKMQHKLHLKIQRLMTNPIFTNILSVSSRNFVAVNFSKDSSRLTPPGDDNFGEPKRSFRVIINA